MSLSISLGENCYVITGDINIIKNHYRKKSNFEACGAIFKNSQIVIPFSTKQNLNEFQSGEKQYKTILKLLTKFGIEDFNRTEDVKDFVSKIDEENKKFEEFSQKAKDIRNNIHDIKDLKNFTSIVHSTMVRKLYPLQLLSSYHLAFSQNACNFSVPGAGKTSIVYGAYAYLKGLDSENSKHVDRLLIISPLTAFEPWKDEYKECFGKETSISTLIGIDSIKRKNHFYSDTYTEITLISYQSASSDSDIKSIQDFLKRNKVMVVLDEAHRIKNTEGGRWAEAILSIAKYANSRVVLTGTPAPNSYQDLHNLYQFIWPDKDIIGYPINYLQELDDNNRTSSARQDIEKLIDNISPFFIRIKKTHLGLPNPIFNEPIMVSMSANQRLIYDYIEKKYIDYFEKGENNNFINKLKKAKLIRLMQCVTNPRLLIKTLDNYVNENVVPSDLDIDNQNVIELIKSYQKSEEVPPKFEQTLKLVNQICSQKGADGKVVIWSIFIQNIHDLKKYFEINGVNCELLYGEIPVDGNEINIPNRKEIIRKFHHENCPYKVIIANPFAVGESISLHKACHNAIYMEKNFNASMYMQSKDRIHRYGLDKRDIVNYYYLISENSVDQTIHDRVLEKEQRMIDILESEEVPLLNINMEDSNEDDEDDDIRAIIKDYHARQTIKTQ